jgi:hypothetical protein
MRSCLRTTDWSGWLDATISFSVLLVVQRASWVTARICEPSLQRVPTPTYDANDADDADDRYEDAHQKHLLHLRNPRPTAMGTPLGAKGCV